MLQKQNLKQKNRCLCGFEKRQIYHELMKTWQYYYNLSKEQILDKKRIRHYKRVIHNLQDKLRIPPTEFIVYEAFGLWFYKLNPELFKEDVTEALMEKGMIKTIAVLESRMRIDLRPNMVQKLIHTENALFNYILSHIGQNDNSNDNECDNIGLASKSDVSPNTPKADEA
jgi:hypothetical protein